MCFVQVFQELQVFYNCVLYFIDSYKLVNPSLVYGFLGLSILDEMSLYQVFCHLMAKGGD